MSKDLGGVTEELVARVLNGIDASITMVEHARGPHQVSTVKFTEREAQTIKRVIESLAMQADAPAGDGERYREALRDISRQFETDFVLGDKIVDSPPRSFVIAYETARAALHPEPAASDQGEGK